MAVWQGVAIDSLKFHQSPPCPTLLSLAGGPPMKQPYSHFRGGPPTGVVHPQGGQPSSTPLDTPRHTPMLWYAIFISLIVEITCRLAARQSSSIGYMFYFLGKLGFQLVVEDCAT
jgi:hypothetical protein